MCSRPKMPPAPPPPPQLPPAPPPPEPVIKSMTEESGQFKAGRAQEVPGSTSAMFNFLSQRRGKSMLTIPRG